jgi:hypothetical protein
MKRDYTQLFTEKGISGRGKKKAYNIMGVSQVKVLVYMQSKSGRF